MLAAPERAAPVGGGFIGKHEGTPLRALRPIVVSFLVLSTCLIHAAIAPRADAEIGAASSDLFARSHVDGSLLVLLREPSDAPTIRLASGDTLVRLAAARAYSVQTDPRHERETLARLLADPAVLTAEPNYRTRTQMAPNDPKYGDAYWVQRINLESAWDTTVGLPSAVIAVLDSGVYTAHPELQGRLLPGYNFVSNTPDANDTYRDQHGTAVALIAAGRGNDGVGGAGVAWNARILPVRTEDDNGNGTMEQLANGIHWAADHGATVINMSVAGARYSPVIANEIAYARAKGIILVAASGDDPNALSYPAADPNVISVTATDQRDQAAYPPSSQTKVDLAAPGVGVRVSVPEKGGSGYYEYSGTSFAVPQVSGVIALMQSVHPGLSQDDALRILKGTARSVGPAAQTGAGIIDAGRALQAALALNDGQVAPADPEYATYARYDDPVRTGAAPRGFIWGPQTRSVRTEPYADAPSGVRQVWYFDKGRLELNDPQSGQITSGLLVSDMVTGQLQTGTAAFERRAPAAVPVAGDLNAQNAVSYATLGTVRAAPPRAVGSAITDGLKADGTTAPFAGTDAFRVTAATTISETNHSVASVFWDYLNSSGTTAQGGRNVSGRLFDPTFFVVGLPITEAYWTTATVGGAQKTVLVQAFERRVLTYTPTNPDGFKVEMGNVGLHYLAWRYGG
jgi:thermitase